jgi:RimJ/RimL family protein N-acetyltransferase
MTDNDLLQGTLVRLAARDPETDAASFARWSSDSEYLRLFGAEPAYPQPVGAHKKQLERLAERTDQFTFLIYPLASADAKAVGLVELDGIAWAHGEGWLGIGLGDRDYWGQGYGTDATRLILRFGFTELNLHRISLTVFDYNARAIQVYKKLGFVEEGRAREFLQRDGRRWDMVFMGLLRSEWVAGVSSQPLAAFETEWRERAIDQRGSEG